MSHNGIMNVSEHTELALSRNISVNLRTWTGPNAGFYTMVSKREDNESSKVRLTITLR